MQTLRILGVKNVTEAVAIAIRSGIILPHEIVGGPIQADEAARQVRWGDALREMRAGPKPPESWQELRERCRLIAVAQRARTSSDRLEVPAGGNEEVVPDDGCVF